MPPTFRRASLAPLLVVNASEPAFAGPSGTARQAEPAGADDLPPHTKLSLIVAMSLGLWTLIGLATWSVLG